MSSFKSETSFYSFNSVNTEAALSLGTSHESLNIKTSLLQSQSENIQLRRDQKEISTSGNLFV